MYLNRWCKDPSDIEILQHYQRFYQDNNVSEINNNITEKIPVAIDYLYLFNRTVWKMQDIVKANPSSVQLFYESLHGILNAHLNVISNNERTINDISNLPIIKNPQSVRAKGRKSNKRKLSNLEQNSAIQKPRKVRNCIVFIMHKYIRINFNIYIYLYFTV